MQVIPTKNKNLSGDSVTISHWMFVNDSLAETVNIISAYWEIIKISIFLVY
jgi:hypothetical protein